MHLNRDDAILVVKYDGRDAIIVVLVDKVGFSNADVDIN
jgi:hypothetical protein